MFIGVFHFGSQLFVVFMTFNSVALPPGQLASSLQTGKFRWTINVGTMGEFSLEDAGLDSSRGVRIPQQGSTAESVEIAEKNTIGESIVSYRRPSSTSFTLGVIMST